MELREFGAERFKESHGTRNILYISVPKSRISSLQVRNVNASSAALSWNWDTLWLEESGMMDQIQGELKGFKVNQNISSSKKDFITFLTLPQINSLSHTKNLRTDAFENI